MANLMKLMKAAKSMQANVEATQEKLKAMRIKGSDPNQTLTIETDGQHQCLSVKVSDAFRALTSDAQATAIQDALGSAHADIQSRSQEAFSEIAEDIQRQTESEE